MEFVAFRHKMHVIRPRNLRFVTFHRHLSLLFGKSSNKTELCIVKQKNKIDE